MRFSVVLPAGRHRLRDALGALRRQTRADFEVVLVGGPGADADDVPAELAAAVRRVSCPAKGRVAAWNAGLAAAAGEVVAFADGGIPEPRWLEELAAAYADPAVGGAGGVVYDPSGCRLEHRVAVRDRGGAARADFPPPLAPYQVPGADPFVQLPATNASFRRAALAAVGGFDPAAAPDLLFADVCERLTDRGYRLVPVDGAAVHHKPPPGPDAAPDPAGRGRRRRPAIPPADPAAFLPFPVLAPGGKRLTVCLVSQEYPPLVAGGAGRFTHELAAGLAATGHEVHVVTRTDRAPAVEWEDGAWVRRVPPAATGGWDAADLAPLVREVLGWAAAAHAEVRRVAAGRPLDLVSAPVWEAEGLFCHLDDELRTAVTLGTSLKAVADLTPGLAHDPDIRELLALERAAVGRAVAAVAPSRAAAAKARADFGAPAAVVPVGVRDRAADYPPGPPDGRVRVLCVGRLEPRKGVGVLLRAAAELCPEFPGLVIEFIGDDRIPVAALDGATYRDWFAQTHGAELWAGRVVFRGVVADDELYRAYAACDVVALPAVAGAAGLAAVEAMMFGKPVIGCPVGAVGEVVAEGVTGLLAYPGSAASLAVCLRRLVSDPGLRRRLGRAGRARYEAAHTPDAMVRAAVRAFTRAAESFAA